MLFIISSVILLFSVVASNILDILAYRKLKKEFIELQKRVFNLEFYCPRLKEINNNVNE